MQTTRSPKILAFVEGMMERMFINGSFGYVDVITMSNGSGWKIEKICEILSSKFFTKNVNPDLIIVWLDRESHAVSVEEFRQKIIDSLVARGAPADRIFVCIPDKMTENVILSDVELIRNEFNIPSYEYISDGENGKAYLKNLFKEKSINYKETIHGVKLLKKMRLKKCLPHNKSVDLFLGGLEVPCWWF